MQHIPSDPQIRNLLDPLWPRYFAADYQWLLQQLERWGG